MLSIITPCSRPQNLSRIWPSIPQGSQWLIVRDAADDTEVPGELKSAPGVEVHCLAGGGRWGNAQRNLGLSLADRDYVYFLDDDNVMHPALPALLAEHAESRRILVVNQHFKDGRLRLKAGPPVRDIVAEWLRRRGCSTTATCSPRASMPSPDSRHREPSSTRMAREDAIASIRTGRT